MLGIQARDKKNLWIIYLVFIAVFLTMLSGCASTPKIDPNLVQKYQPPMNVGEQETLIYVIRQNTILGAAQQIWVACNDEYIANLMAGKYCYFKVPAGLNTINLRQMQIPLCFSRVDFRPGEIVFLYFEYTKGLFYELEKNLGISMIMSLKQGEAHDGTDKNTDFEIGLMNPGLVDLNLMKEATAIVDPDDTHAVVTFIRPQSFIEVISFGIWNQDGLLGNLKGKTFFSVKMPQGKHIFIANSRYYSALKADLKAGKHYYVNVEVSRGWAQANISLLPVKSEVKKSEIQGWIDQSTQMTLDKSAIDDGIKKRLDAALPLVQKTISQVESGELEAGTLTKDDGRI